ncbi:MAG: hypothetical protein JWO60_3304 [Frankiales bacterium]|nr:hypothetical protein [Frankiales bacterium]
MSLQEVHLLQMPVDVWERAQEQSEALQREFSLLATDPHDVPARLLELIDLLRHQFGDVASAQEEELADAADAGVSVIPDLVYRLPPEVGPAAQALGRMLDEADAHCQAGRHLLTLAADEETVRFRWWFLDSMTDQLAGRPPVPWPQYRRQA